MKSIVIAPHPDDEVLGVAGTILRRKSEGGDVAWVIVTGMAGNNLYENSQLESRRSEILKIKKLLTFDKVYELNLPAAKLDKIPSAEIVDLIHKIFLDYEPGEIFVPHPSDVHSDHRIVFDCAISASKWFRCPSIKRILAYETLSETEFSAKKNCQFIPNFFINIEKFLESKLNAMDIYKSELLPHPFPRSLEAMRALATLRGSTSGFIAAEAFELIKEVN